MANNYINLPIENGGSSAGVSSLNGLTGTVSITGSGGISVTDVGNVIELNGNAPTNEIIVQQNPGPGQFSSVVAALASITTNAPSNPFIIKIYPGLYFESQIVMKSYVSLTADGLQDVVLIPTNPSQVFIVLADFSAVSNIIVTGAAGPGGVLFQYTAATTPSGCFIKDCVFGDAETLCYAKGDSVNETVFIIQNCVTSTNVNFTTGFKLDSINNITCQYVISGLFINSGNSTTIPTNFFSISGTAAEAFLSDAFVISNNATPGGTGIHLSNGADVTVVGTNMINMGKCIWIENTGAASNIGVTGMHAGNNIQDIVIDQTTATGSIEGAFDPALCSIAAAGVSILLASPAGDVTITGTLNLGTTFATKTNVSDLIFKGPTMGVFSGGVITAGAGFVINVSSGEGYLNVGSDTRQIIWGASTVTLSANTNNYLYFNNAGTLSASSTIPSTTANILLGRVVTNDTTTELIDASPITAVNYGNLNDSFIRNALGPLFASGCVTTENSTPLHLDVSAGSYYFGTTNFNPTAGTNISLQTFYRDGSGGQTIGSTNIVDVNHYDDGSGTLQALSASQFTKHSLYIVGQGANKQYLLVYGQASYSSLSNASAAPISIAPSYFADGVVLIANLVVQQGSSSIISSGSIIDSRPRVGFAASSAFSGTVTSVGLSLPNIFTVTGSPVATTGTLTGTLATQTANKVFAGPTSGGAATPTFRSIVASDIPTLNQNTTGTSASFTGPLVGDVTGTQGATVVATVGGKTASNVAQSVTDTQAATNANTVSTIVKRDSSGNFSAGTITASLSGNATTATLATTATTSTSFSGSLAGDVTGTQGATVVAANTITNAKAAQMAANTIKGNNTASTANATDLTATQATAMLNAFVGDFGSGGTKGLVPAPSIGSGGTSFLNANGSFATAVTSVAVVAPAEFTVTGGPITTAGTITLTKATQNANSVYAGPSTGSASAPAFRALTIADQPGMVMTAFGDGSDGNVTINSGTTTLTRDIFYNNLTLSGTGAINTTGYKIFVMGTLDLSAAQAGAIFNNGANGGSTATNTAGAAAAAYTAHTIGANGAGGAGGAGATGVGANGSAGGASATAIGSIGRVGAVGGAGTSAAGTGGAAGAVTNISSNFRRLTQDLIFGVTLCTAGGGGGGGSGGGGDGTHASGGGGGGGAGGGIVYVSANIINRSGSTASIIQAIGGNGGTGGAANASSTNSGGGGGGSGGGGGGIYLAYGTLTGSSVSGLLDASGGSGGTGGNGVIGAGGTGGGSGTGGVILQLNINNKSSTLNTGSAGSAGSAPSGATGGNGASTNTFQIAL